jgi:hypothetical protein
MTFFTSARRFHAATVLSGTLLFAAAAAPLQAASFESPQAANARQEAQPERQICKREATPGSRVAPRRVCRTQAEWDRENEARSVDMERPVAPRTNY